MVLPGEVVFTRWSPKGSVVGVTSATGSTPVPDSGTYCSGCEGSPVVTSSRAVRALVVEGVNVTSTVQVSPGDSGPVHVSVALKSVAFAPDTVTVTVRATVWLFVSVTIWALVVTPTR